MSGEVSSHCIYTSTILFTVWDTMMQESHRHHMGAMVLQKRWYILLLPNSMPARLGTVISAPPRPNNAGTPSTQPGTSHEK